MMMRGAARRRRRLAPALLDELLPLAVERAAEGPRDALLVDREILLAAQHSTRVCTSRVVCVVHTRKDRAVCLALCHGTFPHVFATYHYKPP